MRLLSRKIIAFSFFVLFISCESEQKVPSVLKVASGRVERIEFFSQYFQEARNVDVWIPEGYRKDRQYPVVYMHDGQMLFDSTQTWNHQEWGVDETLGKLISEKVIRKCIVVGIWNSGKSRHADYFPQKPFESLPQAFRDSLITQLMRNPQTALFSTDVRSDNYLKFIVNELKPSIDKRYATDPSREKTFIAGSSMGGLISMYAICEYPDVFGGAACLSTHWPGIFTVENNPIPDAFMNYLRNHMPDPATHKIYYDYGTKTLDALYEPFQLRADEVMKQGGYDDSNWKSLKFEGEDHTERAWRERLYIPFTFLMEKN
ncbi:MAG: alpha/beta hydrolase, partial [Bacteroidales bacterium]